MTHLAGRDLSPMAGGEVTVAGDVLHAHWCSPLPSPLFFFVVKCGLRMVVSMCRLLHFIPLD